MKIKILENQYAQNTQTIDTLAGSISSIEKRVLSVNESLEKIVDIIKQHEETEKASQMAAKPKKEDTMAATFDKQERLNNRPMLPSYHVQAVISGACLAKR